LGYYEDLTINYSGVVRDYSDIVNCTFYVNDVLNQTDNDVNISDSQDFYLNLSGKTEDYTFRIDCENVNISASTGVYNYKVDSVQPFIDYELFTDEYAYTKVLDRDIEFNITWTDDNLFAVEYNITFQNGSNINNLFVDNLEVSTYNNYTYLNADNLYTGNYTLSIWGWDSHTKKYIPPKTIKDIDKVDTKGYEFNGVKISGKGIKSKNVEKLKDRYSYQFDYDTYGESVEYEVEGTGKLYKVYVEEYGDFLIDWDSKQWIDFVSKDTEYVNLEKVNDNKYKVYSKLKDGIKKVKFESIGDLNEKNLELTFDVDACPEDWGFSISACIDGQSVKTYIDDNNCGTYNDLPLDNGTISECIAYAFDSDSTEGRIFNIFPLISIAIIVFGILYSYFRIFQSNRELDVQQLVIEMIVGIIAVTILVNWLQQLVG